MSVVVGWFVAHRAAGCFVVETIAAEFSRGVRGAGKRRFWASNLTVLTTANRQRRAVAAVADVPEPGSILQGGSGHQSLFSGWWDDGGDGWMDRKGMAWVGEGRVWVRALVTELAGRTAQERIVWAGSRSNKGPRSPTAPAV